MTQDIMQIKRNTGTTSHGSSGKFRNSDN